MSNPDTNHAAWTRLVRAAKNAPPETAEMPFGFSTRVVSRWSAQPQESTWAMMEWFTWRALAVAMFFMLGSVALGYNGISDVLANETAQASAFIDDLINP